MCFCDGHNDDDIYGYSINLILPTIIISFHFILLSSSKVIAVVTGRHLAIQYPDYLLYQGK